VKIFITGISGFIGSHLADHLIKAGHIVSGVDNFSTGNQTNLAQPILQNTHNCDCRNLPKLLYIIREKRPDFIFHLASTVGVARVLADPRECIENNLDSLRNVLSFGIPGLYTSTSEVYGKNQEPLAEDSDLIFSGKNRWSYATSKLVGEWLALTAQWKVVRLFNVIGPRQSNDYGAVLPRFITQAVNGEPVTVYGTGLQVRSFIDVRDCVRILGSLMDKKFDVVNVGRCDSTSIIDLAYKVNTMFGNGIISYVPYRLAYKGEFEECPCRVPDLTKLNALIGFQETLKLEQTILDISKGVMPSESTISTTDTRASSVAVQAGE